MEENWIKKLPYGKDLDAVSGYMYVGEAEHILSFWDELVKNDTIHTGTNFDLSGDIENIDHSRKMYILYDFLNRVMLYYYDPEKESSAKQMNLKDFKRYIGVN